MVFTLVLAVRVRATGNQTEGLMTNFSDYYIRATLEMPSERLGVPVRSSTHTDLWKGPVLRGT